MGRGSSKAGGGGSGTKSAAGGGGVAIKDIENATLKTTLQAMERDFMSGKTYTYARSQRDGQTIDQNTNVGDVFSIGGVSYKKIGQNQWTQPGYADRNFESDGMARVISGLSGMGNWTYQPSKTPQQAASKPTKAAAQVTSVTRATTGDIQNIYKMPIGTVITAKTSRGQYIGELTKVSARKWVGSQKRKSLYPAPNDVSSAKAMDFEIGNMNLKIKSK